MNTETPPSTDQLIAAPELAILHAQCAALSAAHCALLAAHPQLEEDLCRAGPLNLDGTGWIADGMVGHIVALETSIDRYRREIARARRLALTSLPF